MTLEAARLKCKEYGQEHVLKYYDELSAEQQEALLAQIDETDMSILKSAKYRRTGQEGRDYSFGIHGT